MARAIPLIQTPGVLLRRAGWLMLGGVLLGPLTGCTPFQSVGTHDWFSARWHDLSPDPPVNHVLARWENRVRIVQDSMNPGSAVPVLAGMLYLFNDETQSSAEARGTIVVQMYDITNVASGKPAEQMPEWRFDAERLRLLKRKDGVGEGYTLPLPWYEYRPDIKEVQLQICYVPAKGPPRYAEPQNVTLQSADLPVPVVQQRQIVPALQPRPFAPTAQHQQPLEQIVPASLQQQHRN